MSSVHSPLPALPNEQQSAAVEHGLAQADERALLIIAGAGSGKTFTLAQRVVRLIAAGADPQRLLLMTFSRRAAQDMQRRVGLALQAALKLPSRTSAPALRWCGTFHSVGAQLLREHAGALGLADDFTVQDRADAEDLMGLLRQELGLAHQTRRFPLKGVCLAIYSRVVNSSMPLPGVLQEAYPWCLDGVDALQRLFAAYVHAKQDQHLLDYDDLLLYWAHAMAEPRFAQALGTRFEHVFIDEYQDTNPLQARIVLALKPDGRGLTVVGDDAQAIYSFRAADVRNILEFPQRFNPPARVVTLERNYRSTQPILDACNGVIALAAQRYPKRLWTEPRTAQRPQLVHVEDEAAQAQWVAQQVLAQREAGIRLRAQAVLFRASHHSAALELELARRNIPFVKFGGLKFLEAAHVKDVLAVLRWAENPHGRLAGFRVAQLVPGIGPATARRVVDGLAAHAGADAAAALAALPVPPAARADWQQFTALYTRLRHAGAGDWPQQLQAVNTWYEPQLQRLYEDASSRSADLSQLAALAAGSSSRERFLTELALDPPEATSAESGPPQLDEDYLILSTIHSAKGQEWSSVCVLNVIDGCIPSDLVTGDAAQIDEERRLLYVAMTRARHHLALLVPQRFHLTQQRHLGPLHVYGTRSRFITPALLPLFDSVVPADAQAFEPGPTHATLPALDIAASVRMAWR